MKRFPKRLDADSELDKAESAIELLLEYLGENPRRDGLLDTPARVVKAWKEMTAGYGQHPEMILQRDFDAGPYNQMIACSWIEFYSTCEHHMLPFTGFAHIAYVPSKRAPRVVGLSKMARLVDCFARRLQIQEKLTVEIADAMTKHLKPQGVAVVIQAKHLCMACRGVQKQQSVMATSEMTGCFMKEGPTRSEFFRLIELSRKS